METDSSSRVGSIVDRSGDGSTSALLVLAGGVLFLVPEPVTSILGLLLVLVGAGSWLAGRLPG